MKMFGLFAGHRFQSGLDENATSFAGRIFQGVDVDVEAWALVAEHTFAEDFSERFDELSNGVALFVGKGGLRHQ